MNKFPVLKIGNIELEVPIVQGGMGVKISRANLVSAVSNCGGLGVLASVALWEELNMRSDYAKSSEDALRREIRKTREKTDKPFGINILVALSNYEALCRVCCEEKVDVIFSGAGLPLKLPQYVPDRNIKLVPIVSSGKAADVILRHWKRRYDRLPDAVVVEGPMAGGHLGFSMEELENPPLLLDLVRDVKKVLDEYKDEKEIPLIAAGGIYTGKDILKALEAGAGGVQMATRFITTYECDASDELKQACLDAKKEDVVIRKTPVGLPGRLLKNAFVERVISGERIPFSCPYRCLKTCQPDKSPFCIADALINASQGNLKEGFVMAGANVYRATKLISVRELIDELIEDAFGATKVPSHA